MKHTIIYICIILLLAACRTDEVYTPNAAEKVTDATGTGGFFLLNEGNMGSNSASLDWFDAAAGTYRRNVFDPTAVRGLGDVGNDLQIYDNRLWVVVNCSNLVEIADVGTAQHFHAISIPNPRYIAFDGDFAYVSSYAGAIHESSRDGVVVKINTSTFKIVDECPVGRQPEEMVVVGSKLYVANSGGYTPDNLDNTVSIIDLATFTEERRIEVASNLHHMELDAQGMVWVSSREGSVTMLDPASNAVSKRFDLVCDDMAVDGDYLYIVGGGGYTTLDTRRRSVIARQELAALKKPYGIAVNPFTHEIFITDAADYLTPGTVHCFSPEGVWQWHARTGNIPSRIAFTEQRMSSSPDTPAKPRVKILEYTPAPGQFIGDGWTVETPEQAAAWAEERLFNGGLVSLGAFGGSITAALKVDDHTGSDFWVAGNAFGGSSEAGIVWVAADTNGNGLPDDPWHELAGSDPSVTCVVTYTRPLDGAAVPWVIGAGDDAEHGEVPRNSAHVQPQYFPAWLPSPLILSSARLPARISGGGDNWVLEPFAWGYADNLGSDYRSGAVHLDIAPTGLTHIDFVRVQTAIAAQAGWLGEISTEVAGMGVE